MTDSFTLNARRRPGKGRRRAVVLVALTTALALSGIALAAWLTGGLGNGYSKAGALQPLTTVGMNGNDLTGTLLPGGHGDFVMTVHNPNSVPLTLTDVTMTSGSMSADGPGCDPNQWVGFPQQHGLSKALAASGNTVVTIPNAVTLDPGAPTACQGVTFTIPVELSATT